MGSIILAYFYLEEAKKFNALTNTANYEYTKMRRNEQIKAFTFQKSDYDDEYLCKLLFPLDNISISDDYLKGMIDTEKLNNTDLCKVYDGMMSMGLDCLSVFPAKSFRVLVRKEGLTKAFHDIRIAIIRCWKNLRLKFPGLLNNVNLTDDNEMLDAAESTTDADIQNLLISLVALMIEMEGMVFECQAVQIKKEKEELETEMVRKKQIEDSSSLSSVVKDMYRDELSTNWMKAEQEFQDEGYVYLQKNIQLATVIYGYFHKETLDAYLRIARFCEQSHSVVYPQKARDYFEKAEAIQKAISDA